MNQIITLENGISLNLNNHNFTAKVVNAIKASGDIFIPRSIHFESNEYVISSIDKGSFRENKSIKSLAFPLDSELHLIEGEAFSNSSIEQITIPSSCEELKEGCFLDALKLNHILISPRNNFFNYVDPEQKMISRKSQKSNETFDVLAFSCHDIINANIPTTIEEIGPFSFYRCSNLKSVTFSKDSKLHLIDKCAFLSSSLKQIVIPKHVTHIKEYSFSECERLFDFEIEKDSELREIGQCAFSKTSLLNVVIPKSVKIIGECAFSMCSLMKSIEFLSDDLKCEKFCFYLCRNLSLVSFPNTNVVPIKINAHDSVNFDFSLFVCAYSTIE